MSDLIKDEVKALSDTEIKQIKHDYRQGTGLTCWDISRKYSITFAACCYIVKRDKC